MTNTAKHTPGPWTVKPLLNYAGRVVGSEITPINVWFDEEPLSDETAANAHLIAAAPAMYLELQNIVEGLTDEITRIIEGNKPDTARLDYLANKAGQAVAQAEGK